MNKKQWTPQEMGRKGGKKSKRVLTREQAQAMADAKKKKAELRKLEEM